MEDAADWGLAAGITAHGVSCASEFAFGFGDGTPERFGSLDPFLHAPLRIGDSLFVGGTVGHAAGDFGDTFEYADDRILAAFFASITPSLLTRRSI